MPDELNWLERAVIALSRNDPAWSLTRQGPVARWVCARGYGPQPLANPRLEALRRYAILRRIKGKSLAKQEYELLCEKGFDYKKINEINKLLTPHHLKGPSPRPSLKTFKLPLLRMRRKLNDDLNGERAFGQHLVQLS